MIEIINIGINSMKEIISAVLDGLGSLGLGISEWTIIILSIIVIKMIVRKTKTK